jgi:hypothetical protein
MSSVRLTDKFILNESKFQQLSDFLLYELKPNREFELKTGDRWLTAKSKFDGVELSLFIGYISSQIILTKEGISYLISLRRGLTWKIFKIGGRGSKPIGFNGQFMAKSPKFC